MRLTAEATDPNHPTHSWVHDHYAGMHGWLTEAVRAGQERGEIHTNAPVNDLARTTIAVMDGLQQQWPLAPAFLERRTVYAPRIH